MRLCSHLVLAVGRAAPQVVRSGNNLVDGAATVARLPEVMARVAARGFGNATSSSPPPTGAPLVLKRPEYAAMFGPTVGDRIKLGDTCLLAEVEKDFTVYGDELKFGGGKVLREGMGQATGCAAADALDTVITNALIIDPVLGIVKADIGIKGVRTARSRRWGECGRVRAGVGG